MRHTKLLVVALLFVFAAACGGSGDGLLSGSSQSSAISQSSSSQPSSAQASTAASNNSAGGHSASAGSTLGVNTKNAPSGTTSKPGDSSSAALGDTFKSSAGYSIQYPKGWTAKENIATLAGINIDGFLSPDSSNNFAANVNVLCEAAAGGLTTDAYLKANLDQLGGQKINAKDTGPTQTGIGAGHLLTYTTSFGGQSVDLAQIILTDKRCGWVLTLTTTAGERDKYMKTFMAMAMSFKTTK